MASLAVEVEGLEVEMTCALAVILGIWLGQTLAFLLSYYLREEES